MDFAHDVSTIARALETLSPSQIINSPVLLPRFQEFISRCTEIERQRLLRPLPLIANLDSRHFHHDISNGVRETRNSGQDMNNSSFTDAVNDEDLDVTGLNTCSVIEDNLETAIHPVCSPHTSAFAQRPACPSLVELSKSRFEERPITSIEDMPLQALPEAQVFFSVRLGPRISQTKHLVRAIIGFVEALTLDAAIYENLWSAQGRIFSGRGSGPIARFHRLCEGFVRIKRGQRGYDCANRLCHIFLEHDLEQLIASGSFHMSRGRGRKTCALSLQAANLGENLASLQADRKAGRTYLQLLMEAGPGLLLIVGGQVHTIWERKLSKEDVTLVLAFLKEKVPQVLEKGRSLDKTAARLIFDGFVSYGWTYTELGGIRSKLLERLKQYLHLPQLEFQQRNMLPSAEDPAPRGTSTLAQLEGSDNSFNEQAANVSLAPSHDLDLQLDEPRDTLQMSFGQSSDLPQGDFNYCSAYPPHNNLPSQIALDVDPREVIGLENSMLGHGSYGNSFYTECDQLPEISTASPPNTSLARQLEQNQRFDSAEYSPVIEHPAMILGSYDRRTNLHPGNSVVDCHLIRSCSDNFNRDLPAMSNNATFPVVQSSPNNIEGWLIDERAQLPDSNDERHPNWMT